ncbi:hypothetical protein [Aquabacterium sp.]|uniref:hypothetical protein n=1 Tax=Aquabacterium sp. TaxID=1872578 RepID=UPI002BBBCAAD|nr:hypothetical protein [Aquabacterium sp.]HSW05107.1 hypothetical protein [Aquabacterium sp.]
MITTSIEQHALAQTSELETAVANVERGLAGLADSLRERDARAVEVQANELHRALAAAVQRFMHAARHGGVPEPMRRRLARASAQVASQRETLARATAALDRAIDVLMPDSAPGNALYGARGLPDSPLRGGSISA